MSALVLERWRTTSPPSKRRHVDDSILLVLKVLEKYESLGGPRALRFLNILKFLRFRVIERYPGFFRFFGFLLCTKDGI